MTTTTTNRSCTPKKFYTSFKPQFNTEQKCNDMGKVYYDLGYGYFCSSDQDDCGDTYYQLILYDENKYYYDYTIVPKVPIN